MAGNDPTLEEVLLEVFDSKLAEIHTALPGRIERYYPEKQTADVLPMIKNTGFDASGNPVAQSFPVLPNVPVAFPRGGGFFCSFPLAKGDFVLVVFCEAAIDQWRAKGSETYPGDLRKHGLTGAVAYPGLYPSKAALTSSSDENMVLGKEGGTVIHVKEDEIALGSESPSDFVALASLVKARLDAIQAKFDAHIHTTTATVGAGAVVGVISTPSNGTIGPLDDIASEVVKAE